jgi:hypothetical protein
MKQLTLEEELQCRDHLDAILMITSNMKLSTILDVVRQQMHLSAEDERLVFDVIQKSINDSIFSSMAQMGEQLMQLMNNPVMQADMKEKIDAMRTPKGGTEL